MALPDPTQSVLGQSRAPLQTGNFLNQRPAPISIEELQQIFEQQKQRQQPAAPPLPQQPAPNPAGQPGGGMQGNPFIDILKKLFLGG